MPKMNKSRDRNTKNGQASVKSNIASQDSEREAEVDLVTPEQWVRFGESFRLSQRELEILVLTSRDLPRKAIARELGIAFDTVNKFCDRLHKKTGGMSRVALLRLLLQFA